MTRVRVRPTGLQVALFPFLAVLICTMGVLIVLLVIVVKRADLKADKERVQETAAVQAELEQLQAEIQESDFVGDALHGSRSDWTQQLQQTTARRSHYESHTRELREQLQALIQQAEQLTADPTATDPKLLAALEQQIASKEKELAALRERIKQAGTRYAVVAYDGRNGTQRRPIYIECSPEGIDLRPFDLHFDLAEFPRPILPGNPLDAAVLAIRDAWQKADPRGVAGAPYPLILVRPGGSDAYAVAREALKSWDSEFGHQIVPKELALEFPPPEADLSQELQRVVADARRRQQMLIAAAMRLSGGSIGNQPGSAMGGASGGSLGGTGSSGVGSTNSNEGTYAELTSDTNASGDVASGSGSGTARGGTSTPSTSPTGTGTAGSSSGQGSRDFVLRASGRRGGFVPAAGSTARENRSTGFASNASSSGGTWGNNSSGSSNSGRSPGGSSGQGTEGEFSVGSLAANSSAAGSADADTSDNATSPVQSLANARGQGWALPVRNPTAIAFRRPLRMTCLPDRLLLHDEERPDRIAHEFLFAPSIESAMDPMVNHLQGRIETWGLAGDGAYWKPELHIDVQPGAEARFQQLRTLLDGSGLDVKEIAR